MWLTLWYYNTRKEVNHMATKRRKKIVRKLLKLAEQITVGAISGTITYLIIEAIKKIE